MEPTNGHLGNLEGGWSDSNDPSARGHWEGPPRRVVWPVTGALVGRGSGASGGADPALKCKDGRNESPFKSEAPWWLAAV